MIVSNTPLKSTKYKSKALPPSNTLVTFELFADGDKTRLRLTHEGLESFSQDNPDFAKENFTAGWIEIDGTNLKKFVEL